MGQKTYSRILSRILITAGIVTLIGYGGYVFFKHTPFGLFLDQNPGPFDRERFQAIVQEVRAIGLKPGEEKELRLDNLSNPKSLRALKAEEQFHRGQGAGSVWAAMTEDGKLKVVVETKDLGHAGEYGFAYSDTRLSPEPFGEGWLSLNVPGHLKLVQPKMQLDDHWWEVLYNLD
jgi:hypothetical protein